MPAEPEPEAEAEPSLFADLPKAAPAKPAAKAILPTSPMVRRAIEAYNAAAARHGWSRCDAHTGQRKARVAKRLADIGGLEPWAMALSAIPLDEFLSGRVGGRNGLAPFRLTLDRLLQTDGGMGDVLARMIDLAMQRKPAQAAASDAPAGATDPVNGKLWGWWREGDMLAKLRAIPEEGWRKMLAKTPPNGLWPWWALGAPPGHRECALPAAIAAERGYVAKYAGGVAAAKEETAP